MNTFEEAIFKLKSINQEHLLINWEALTEIQKAKLLQNIDEIDVDFFKTAKKVLNSSLEEKPIHTSLIDYESTIDPQWISLGQDLLRNGKCALLVLAGGSGSRLNFEGPKGCFPITPICQKSLFQYMAEKVLALSLVIDRPLEMAIMTSPMNHEETVSFFEKNNYFGLKISQVHFFSQKLWPLLSLEGDLFLETPSKIAAGPNGNGDAFKELYESPIYERWQALGIEYINVIPIENPLADPFDARLFGFHHSLKADVAIKAVMRSHHQEKVGVIVEKGHVVEYGEVRLHKEEEALAFIGLFSIRLKAIFDLKRVSLPLHVAKKRVKMWDRGRESQGFACKFERFLFEVFPYVSSVKVLLFPRKMCFAPLKNFEGDDSIAVVQQKLQAADRDMYYQISGMSVPEETNFELSASFYYPSDALKKRWQNKTVPNNSYVEDL